MVLSNLTQGKNTLPHSVCTESNYCQEKCISSDRMKSSSPAKLQASSETGLIEDAMVEAPRYRDFSTILSPSPLSLDDSLCTKFPSKLYRILSNPGLKTIITWLPHGRGWRIVNQEALEAKVLPRYFDNGKYSTFRRQINGWGFRRIRHRCYYHEMFLRGMPHLCQYMKRMKKEELAKRGSKRNLVDPNFVKQCRLNPMPEDNFSEIEPSPELSTPHFMLMPEDMPVKRKPASDQSGADDGQMLDDISIDVELCSDLSITNLDDIFE